VAKLEGVQEVIKRLMTFRKSTAAGMERGYVRAGAFLLRKSQQVVPVDTGALKNSGFTRKTGSGFSTDVTVGYTQSYAIYVHENLEARHKPGKIAKYLEKPARDYRQEMLQIIRREAVK
jgi:hypothetical protein